MTDSARDDYRQPLERGIGGYFPDFLALLYPRVYAGIDWSKGHAFLDKELQQVFRVLDWLPQSPGQQ